MPQRYIVSFGSSTLPDEWTDFRCTNTLYYQGVSGAQSGEVIAQEIADAYASVDTVGFFVFGAIEVRAYDFDGVTPTGAPVAVATAQQDITQSPGPREVAVALSYKAGEGPRGRGRIFLGPIGSGLINGEYIPTNLGQAALALGGALLNIITLGAQWSLYSRTVQGFASIVEASVDNAWDTQRSRGLPPTADFAPAP